VAYPFPRRMLCPAWPSGADKISRYKGHLPFYTDLELMGLSTEQLRAPRIWTTCFYAFMFLYTIPDKVEAFYCLERFVEWCLNYAEPDL